MENVDIRQLLPQGTLLQGGKYRVVRYLSSGNFGNTYIVENTGMQVQFAMKEFFLRNICYRTGGAAISVSPAIDPEKVDEQREKFKKEARRLYGLSSRHLVHVNDMFEENGTVYYVMDFVKGESLARYMERTGHPLTEEQTVYILNQLLDGLDEVHAKQIWHLDLKPENIMIDSVGNVVIIDFGASKQMGRSGKYTGTSNILCYTPGYAPAEQVNQNLNAIGPWTDIYALGATLYNLLTGIDPSTMPPATLRFPPSVSAKTQQLVRRMMSTDLQQRPQSIVEVRQLLAAGAPAVTSASATTRKKWLPAVVVMAVVAVVVVLVQMSSGGKNEGLIEEQKAVSESEVVQSGPEVTRIDTISHMQTAIGECLYIGPYDADTRPHGIGEAQFNDGRYYQGPFVHGVLTGDSAFFRYPNGDTFVGSFVDNAFHEGRYTFAIDGAYFVGLFKDGSPDYDKGKLYNKDGTSM